MENWLKSGKIRVLLVEDDEDDYILTTSLLTEIHSDKFEPVWAKTFEEGLEHITAGDYDICLLDYRLGSHNGLELLREARSQGVTRPFILLTGQSDVELDFQAMRAGAADFQVKGQLNSANLERSIRYAIQQKQMEEERVARIRDQEARSYAESANKAKDDFLAMVSHELRTPLNAMLGWVGILRGNKGNEDVYARAIDAIERSAKTQNRLVNDLLDISRIASGNLWIEKQPLVLGSIIEQALDEAYPAANAKSITIESDADDSVKWVQGDPSRLEQVVNNLLQNAIKFTPEGGQIKVSLKYVDGNARLAVADTGRGIESEFLPYVFDRYKQAREAKDRRLGLGLGLAIARHIVELHGGSIVAESAGEGQGSTFSVVLPVTESIASAV
ncbi:MAG TPA: ATP-binding protein [Pyrinomonadaceae bacterium]|nr:ATP-binding protein [Pyrinomonadaceae bacterium]